MKRTIEIDDTLQEIVDSAINDLKEILLDYLNNNPDTDETPDLGNDLDYDGRVLEMIDGSVPIYTHEIDTIFYLHGADVEEAFDNAGIGDKDDEHWPNGWRAAAIYCYLDQECNEWYFDNAETVFDEWKAAQEAKQQQGDPECK